MKTGIKPIAVTLCTFIALCMSACTKDAEDLIVGKWNVESITVTDVYTNHPDPSINGTHTETEYVPEGYSMYMVFNKDKTIEMVQSGGDRTITETGTYSVDGKTLSIMTFESYTSDDGQTHSDTHTEVLEIVSIDDENMTLRISEGGFYDVYNGVRYQCYSYSDYNMKRI